MSCALASLIKTKTLIEIAKEEILEETGYDVPLEKMEKYPHSTLRFGFAGGRQTLYFAVLDDSMKVSEGGGR